MTNVCWRSRCKKSSKTNTEDIRRRIMNELKMESSDDENTIIVMMLYFHFETTHRKKYVHRNNFAKLSVRRAPTTAQYGIHEKRR